ncbi:MAG: TatD family hydrolase [Bacteroidia bacterium]
MFVNIHTHRKPQLLDEICIRNAYLHPSKNTEIQYFTSVGLHPWFASKMEEKNWVQTLQNSSKIKGCVAIGEIGLDENYPNMQQQIKAFHIQVEWAQEQKMPILIHQVKALSEIQLILKNFTQPIVLHGYNGAIEKWKQLNFYNNTFASFGKNVFNPSKKLIHCIQTIPLNRVFLETDQSNISIQKIYEQFALVRSEPIALIRNQMLLNFESVFGKQKFK